MLLGFSLGAVVGLLVFAFAPTAPWVEPSIQFFFQPLSQVFLRIIFSAVVPLVFCSLVLGVYEMGDFKALGRISVKTLLYTIFASMASVAIGLGLVSWFKP